MKLYEDYDRRGVRDLFEPDQPFTPGSGSWGLSGVIGLKDEPGSFVFFVSFGRSQGEHQFDEGIDTNGVLRWQSQVRQRLDNRKVQQWIAHDSEKNAIHLFLRTSLSKNNITTPYTYLGELEYFAHNPDTEEPVDFSFKLKSWPIPGDVANRIDLQIESRELKTWEKAKQEEKSVANPQLQNGLEEVSPPLAAARGHTGRKKFNPRLDINFARRSERARLIGAKGEELVVLYEQTRLARLGREDLAGRVEHTSLERGDGAGYDILSYFEDGREMFIEVKATTQGEQTDFLISANEMEFSELNSENYALYRVFDLDEKLGTGRLFVLFGNVRDHFDLHATEFRVSLPAS